MNDQFPTDAELDAMIGPPLEWSALWAAMDANPTRWQNTTEHMFYEMLNAVPPAAMGGGAFLVGEASHDNAQGEAVYACFRAVYGEFEARYMTRREFREFLSIRFASAAVEG